MWERENKDWNNYSVKEQTIKLYSNLNMLLLYIITKRKKLQKHSPVWKILNKQ